MNLKKTILLPLIILVFVFSSAFTLIDEDENDVLLLFADTGIGISESDKENLFSDFVRIKNEKTRNIGGSGLGLSIVKQVVDLYRGSITVESVPDVGTAFKVRIPKKFN